MNFKFELGPKNKKAVNKGDHLPCNHTIANFSHDCAITSYFMTIVEIKFAIYGYRISDLPCFTAFLFFDPYSNLKFIFFTYTCLLTFFVTSFY